MLTRILWSLLISAALTTSASAQDLWVPTTNIIGLDQQPLSNNPITIPGDTAIYASNFEGLFRSIDRGVTWTLVSQQMVTEQWNVKRMIRTKNGTLVATRHDDGTLYSTDNGKTWAVSSGLPFMLVQNIAQHPEGALFASVRENVVMRSVDNGKTWSAMNSGLPEGYWGEGLIILPNGDIIVGTGFNSNYAVYRSSNKGASWTKVNALEDALVLTLVQDEQGRIFAGTEGRGVVYSSDNGNTWHQTDTTGMGYATVESIAIGNDSSIFAGAEGYGVFRSFDGNTWTLRPGAGTNPNLIAVAQDGYVYAGVAGGMVRSTESTGDRIQGGGTGSVRPLAETRIKVAYDPLQQHLSITGASIGATYRLLDILGRTMGADQIPHDGISMRHLPMGTYLAIIDGVSFTLSR